jgi:hypothetical protein
MKGAPFLEGPKGSLAEDEIRHPESGFYPRRASRARAAADRFVESVKLRRPFALNEGNGFRSATIVNLGIVAMRLGRGFAFDPVALTAVNDPAADRFIYQQMRAPWLM